MRFNQAMLRTFAPILVLGWLAPSAVPAEAPSMAHESSTAWREAGVVATAASPQAALHTVPIRAVQMKPGFWQPRMEANRLAGIPRLLALLEEHGVVDNFRRLSGHKKCDRRGPFFTDSDLYKWMEAVALVLQSTDDARLRESLDRVIDEVLATQGKDGYINTWFVDDRAGQRFTRLGSDHELYCAGHLFQAAVAHHRATGSRTLLDGACRFADYLCETFGPDKKVQGHDGHPEVEMALIELYRTTGHKRYLDLAGYLLNHQEFTKRKAVDEHAVRMMYLCAGGVDYFLETGEQPFWAANLRLWDDLTAGKMYVTGSVGSRHAGEAFGQLFELPNYEAYGETCAAIASAFWNWRLLAATGDAKYADLFERVLYNGFLAGVSLSGDEYFYVNPLASRGGHRRRPWYDCTCCPPNVQRMIASVPGCIFSTSGRGVHVHLYDDCILRGRLSDGTRFTLAQQTDYPWDGKVTLEVSPEKPSTFEVNVRIPGWCRGARVTVNGQPAEAKVEPGSYCRISRSWKEGDRVELDLPMPVVALVADRRIAENRGCIALTRGPIVYCFEQADNPGVAIDRLAVRVNRQTGAPEMTASHEPGLLKGVTVLRGRGAEITEQLGALYRPLAEAPKPSVREVSLTAIPYDAWANRDAGAMAVWVIHTPGD